MNCKEKQEKCIALFEKLSDPGSQCDYLMNLGMRLVSSSEIRQDKFKIQGCKTNIWLNTEIIPFSADSDSLLVKGILKIMQNLYLDASTKEIVECPPIFLNYVSDDVIYPEVKGNGIMKCYEKLIAQGGKL